MIIVFSELVGYIGIIWLQGSWYKHGKLTEGRFALLQIAFWSLFILTIFLAISTTTEVTIMGIVLSILCWVVGYPMARWMYNQMFLPK